MMKYDNFADFKLQSEQIPNIRIVMGDLVVVCIRNNILGFDVAWWWMNIKFSLSFSCIASELYIAMSVK